MKIVCQSCGAKYAIADEKIKGKVFKIRCKKCNEAIVIKGVDEESGGSVRTSIPDVVEENEVATNVFDYAGYNKGGGGDPQATWHIVVDGEQRGPFSMEQLRNFQEAGTINPEMYVWREGFDQWKPIREVAEFGVSAEAPVADPVAPADSALSGGQAPASGGGLFDTPSASDGGLFGATGGLFGGGDRKADSPFGSAGGLFTGGGAGKQKDVFSSTGASMPKDDLFGGIDATGPQVAAGPMGAMTGARNESSVLFSLSNLQALASTPSPGKAAVASGPSPVTSSSEASGLIDIRSLASALADDGKKDSSGIDDLLSFGGGGFAPALGAPVLAASRHNSMSLGLKIALAAGGVVLLAVLVVLTVMLMSDSKEDSEKQIAVLLAKIESMEKSGASEEDKAKARAELANAQTSKTEENKGAVSAEEAEKAQNKAGEKKPDKGAKAEGAGSGAARKTDAGGKTSRSESSGTKASEAPVTAPPSSGIGTKGKASSELDELLGGGGPAKRPQQPAKPAATSAPSGASSSGGSEMLSREAVQGGLNGVAAAVKRCGQGETGSITIQVVISPSGRVSSATPMGSYAGTPVGSCAARAAQAARFPKSSKELTVKYPFKL
ncbi:MAG: zinc-ribbon domain-containing protein [Myxococcota bacterium]|jgi:predicted Zn finger-like uncharacterized protein|nr:zinc-ribbon domain-containing protein [Myxococcota bacterium]